MDDHSVFEAHLDHYLQVCHVPYSQWRKIFQTANKGAPLACLKRAYWCYLMMLPDAYNSEIMVLTCLQKEICKYYQNQSGLFIRQWHRKTLCSIVWQYGINAGTNFVEGKQQMSFFPMTLQKRVELGPSWQKKLILSSK
eukprot:3166316-Rhodomonas_salina.1